MGLEVLIYVPNLIGYLRISLAVLAFVLFSHPPWFVILYTVSIALDGFDGYIARKLHQTSVFGAWFDVVIDLFTRGYLWCALFRSGYVVAFLEWLTFVATHSRGENWKRPESDFPLMVKKVMEKGFKTPLGCFTVGSIHILPLWLYGYEARFLTDSLAVPLWVQLLGISVFTIGRTIGAAVEVFYIKEYVLHLLNSDLPVTK